jgi:endonuclease/exonuclease/phosphatase (EEP) superfamily protein YafD
VAAATQIPETERDSPRDGPGDGMPVRAAWPRRWARVADVVIVVALLGIVGVWALRFVDSTAYPVVVLQTAGPLVVVALILLTAATLLLRRWWVLIPVGTALAVGIWSAVPAWTPSTTPGAEVDLTVMSSNLHLGQANARQLMDAVRYLNVDVLVLLEVTPQAIENLDDQAASSYFTFRVGEARPADNGTMVLSRFPLGLRSAGDDPQVEATANAQPEVDITVADGTVRLKVAHPTAPLRGATSVWRDGLSRLEAWKARQKGPEPLVVAGDFNACSGHPSFRDLADGLTDAERASGAGWVRTWPFADHRPPPYVQIDHVLSRGLALVDAGQVAYNGTDHAAVWASYSLPGAAANAGGR